jgi:hypothetical protein
MNPILLIFLILVCCAPKGLGPGFKNLPTRAPHSVSLDRPHLFPNGIYSHKITMIDSQGKKREFHGFLRLSEHEITVVGLSNMGTTFFKLSENIISEKISYRFYYPVPKKFKKSFVTIYSSMKKIFLVPLAGHSSHYVDSKHEIEVHMSRYDKNRIPMALAIKYRNYSMLINLDKYQIEDK